MIDSITQIAALREKAEADIMATLVQLHKETGLAIQRVDVTMVTANYIGLRELQSYPASVRVELRL